MVHQDLGSGPADCKKGFSKKTYKQLDSPGMLKVSGVLRGNLEQHSKLTRRPASGMERIRDVSTTTLPSVAYRQASRALRDEGTKVSRHLSSLLLTCPNSGRELGIRQLPSIHTDLTVLE